LLPGLLPYLLARLPDQALRLVPHIRGNSGHLLFRGLGHVPSRVLHLAGLFAYALHRAY
jgi:hypothetical protein